MENKHPDTAKDRQSGMDVAAGQNGTKQVIDEEVVPIDGRDPRTKPLTRSSSDDEAGQEPIHGQSSFSKWGFVIVLAGVVLAAGLIGWNIL